MSVNLHNCSMGTLVDVLRRQAENRPNRKAFAFLNDGETEGSLFTYAELDRQARAIGALLQNHSQKGDRALLLYPPGLEFIAAFFGCLYAGVIAIPAYPPRPNRPMPRLEAIITDAQAKVVLTVTSVFSDMEKRFIYAPDLKELHWLITDKITDNCEKDWIDPEISPETIAFLQYTSGSTALPKGVMVSHGNLVHNQIMIEKAYGHSEDSTYVNWLPLFHDMGLIGNVIQSIYIGTTCILMAPTAFLQKPYRWLKAVSDYKGHTSGGPNFAYDLCVKMITPEQRDTLDLSNWRSAFNGAEPIRYQTLERFAEVFKSCGFRREAFYPCYGLAEATLFVTGRELGTAFSAMSLDSASLEQNRIVTIPSAGNEKNVMVGSGHVWMDQEVIIADPETLTACPPDRVGEIWISSPSIAKGYWNKPQETEYYFNAYLNDSHRGPFLRTGDLGFFQDGELFITGRLKDLIIIRGRNHYPQDIELTVEESHHALRPGNGAAFSVDVGGEERLVVVQEVERQYRHKGLEDVFGTVRKAISETYELQVYAVVLINPGTILKTSSGKIQRRACKELFLKGQLETVKEWHEAVSVKTEIIALQSGEDVKDWVISLLATKLGVGDMEIDLTQSITYYGVDSLKAIELIHLIESTLGISLSMGSFFENSSIAQFIMELQTKFENKPLLREESARAQLSNTGEHVSESPLTTGQKALWFLYQLQPESVPYNIAKAVRLKNNVDSGALQRALQELVEHHPMLRATFPLQNGEPILKINPRAELCFKHEDASSWSELFLNQRMVAEAYQPFNLEEGPLFKVNLYKRAENESILLLSIHHIITDFWSLAIFINELGLRYSAIINHRQLQIFEAQMQYTDYVRWSEEALTGPEGERLKGYWENQLAGDLPLLNLPIDKPRPPVQTFNGALQPFTIPSELTHSLKELAKTEGVTLFMLLLAAFDALLYRYSGQEKLLVGTLSSGRDKSIFADIMGYFVNPLVLRADFTERLTFRELLAQIRKTVIGAYEHQSYPFPRLVGELQPQRDSSRSPVFQVMFAFQKAYLLDEQGLTPFAMGIDGAELTLGELLLESMAFEQRTAQFDLTLSMAENAPSLIGTLEYNTDLFEPATVERLARHFQCLLESIISQPGEPVSLLKILTEAEQNRFLVQWNNTAMEYPSTSCFHELFAAQVERTPHAVAVIFEKQALTYKELNYKANQLAGYLRRYGVGPEVLVGICLERSINMLVGLLGILKAGGVYVPIDPTYPVERIAYMFEDAGLTVLLTQKSLLSIIPAQKARIVRIDEEEEQILLQSGENPVTEVTSDNLAYIIYTSGSTGKPKGVQIPHRALTNFLTSMKNEPGLGASDKLLSVTTLSFDIAALEIYLPLTVGACVVLAGREVTADGAGLAEKILEHGITVMQATPATWRMLLEAGWEGNKNLKILCGGEALPSELACRLLPKCNALWNMYGPTETTIWSAVCKIESGNVISIGHPIGNTQIYILNENLQPAPVGVAGELYIGGAGLARGYYKHPELTAERFFPNPFLKVEGENRTSTVDSFHSNNSELRTQNSELIYKTGDLARYHIDGSIEVLGRIDHQVKVRGFRIELGEIETVLVKHPAIHEIVVMAREIVPGDHRLVAYYVPVPGVTVFNTDLRSFVKQELPDYMVPSLFVALDALPLTPNGKVNRNALPVPDELLQKPASFVQPQNELEKSIAQVWSAVLNLKTVGSDDNFFDLGGHSLLLGKVRNSLKNVLNKELTMMDMFRYPTVSSLARFVSNEKDGGRKFKDENKVTGANNEFMHARNRQIAVIGMAGRFPGARNLDEFWSNLRDGVESITFFEDEELKIAGISEELLCNPNYVKARAILDGVDLFDASFFGFSPRETEALDPQHRLFLECAWELLENAGYNTEKSENKIGVYAGVGLNHYLLNFYGDRDLVDSIGGYQTFIGNDKDFVPTRVSYKLNLKGPSISVQTACSSSLVAVHLACRSLIDGECDIALAGGVSIKTPQEEGYLFQEGGIPSPDGHCRAFDVKAQGTVFGNGVGIVALKQLDKALRDGDHICAVIRGSAINNDGILKIGYTAPSIEGQAEVIREALANAEVEPDTITYIEAHGTGTELGDPIEIAALKDAFHGSRGKGFCAVGSVKTNIGHLDTAAGISGLIKTILALQNGFIPPSLNFDTPHPQLDLQDSPFYINNKLSEWKANNMPRRAGVSSFGIGGTNVHLILEEAPNNTVSHPSRPWQMLVLSAKTSNALEAATINLANYLQNHPAENNSHKNLADIAYTLQVGRRAFDHRRVVICHEGQDAFNALQNPISSQVFTGYKETGDRSPVFMFPGQGTQYVNMALELYRDEKVFHDSVDFCCHVLEPQLGFDLRKVLYPGDEDTEVAAERLQQTSITQPALFVIEYSLAKLWMAWGVNPRAMIGHSIGEYVAACLAGVFSLEDALALVAARGRMIQSLPAGCMLAVSLSEEQVQPYLGAGLAVAAVNSHDLCVVSGTGAAVTGLELQLREKGIVSRKLYTSHAFHSLMMDPILEPFAAEFKKIKLNAPCIPYISNLTGTWIKIEEATDPDYWVKHLRQPVFFANGLKELAQETDCILLEVGPGQALSSLARRQLNSSEKIAVLSSMRHYQEKEPDMSHLLKTLGKLWIYGVKINWEGFYNGEKRCRLPLPTYPFERHSYWIRPRIPGDRQKSASAHQTDINECFYIPSWKKSMPPVLTGEETNTGNNRQWMVLAGTDGLSPLLRKKLEEHGQEVIEVTIGEGFSKLGDSRYSVNPEEKTDFERLFVELKTLGKIPGTIIHLWTIMPQGSSGTPESMLRLGFHNLLHIARAVEKCNITDMISIEVVTNNLYRVESGDTLDPAKAILTGPCKVIPQEYHNCKCRIIDIGPADFGNPGEDLIEQLAEELLTQSSDAVIAMRGMERWIQAYEKTSITAGKGLKSRLREGGIYLITGGTGGLGLEMARFLAGEIKSKLILINRSPFPDRGSWAEILKQDKAEDITYKIKVLTEIERLGSEVMLLNGDVADETQVQEVIKKVLDRYGAINGIIHAAGVPGGGIIELKKDSAITEVFRPKIQGALVLQSLLQQYNLDFFILASSINAIVGGFGQVDYTAANAFLDAFAQLHFSKRGTFYVAINWDRWQEVGMGVKKAKSDVFRGENPTSTIHPLLDKCILETAEKEVYATEFSLGKHWVLSEHIVAGEPTVPGTTYLEMVRAAFEKHTQDKTLEIMEVVFLVPLVVKDGQSKETLVIFERDGEDYYFQIVSRLDANRTAETHWQEHVRGKVSLHEKEPERRLDLAEIASHCTGKEIIVATEDQAESFVRTGPRWQNLKKVRIGVNEALVELKLPGEFSGDFDRMKLHPALMDVATGSMRRYMDAGNYLPLAYEKLTIKGNMSNKIFGHVKFKDLNQLNQEIITCDMVITDESGLELIAVEGFTMRKVKEPGVKDGLSLNQESKGIVLDSSYLIAAGTETVYEQLLARSSFSGQDGLLTKDGIEAFKRVLYGCTLPQIIISRKAPQIMIEETNELNRLAITKELEAVTQHKPVHARPMVNNPYIAPGDQNEQKIAAIWQKVLGIEQVGAHDNFFELGGTSLSGIQVVTELKKTFQADIPTVSIFEAPTIHLLSKFLNPENKQESFEHVQDRAGKKKEALERQRLARERIR